MATISAGGIGSGLDVNGILEQIVAAEREPTENRLNIKETTLQAELSAFGTIKGAVSSFQSSLGRLSSAALFNGSNATVGDETVLSATAASIAPEGNYSVEVKNLAQTHSLASITFVNLDDEIGVGTLKFSFGSTDYSPGTDFATADDSYNGFVSNAERSSESVVIDSSNNTISGIRDSINEADIGVTASIIDDGSGYRLLLSSSSLGEENSLQISVDEGGAVANNIDTDGLSILAFNSSATNIEQTQEGQDALISINGLSVKRDSNVLTEAIPGVTLSLKKADIGNPVQVSVKSTNVADAKENIGSLVSSYNELTSLFNGFTKFGKGEETNGLLLGDTTARNMLQQIRRELGEVVNNGGTYSSLGSIGITTNRDGSLAINETDLTKALETDFDSVAQLFYASGNATDNEILFTDSTGFTNEGSYAVSVSEHAKKGTLTTQSIDAPITLTLNNSAFSLNVDGVSSDVIRLSLGTYNDLNDLAQEIQNRINADANLGLGNVGARVSYESGAFKITSDSYGSDSKIKIDFQNSTLGFTADAVIDNGADIIGTINGEPALGDGRFLTGTGLASGLLLEVTGGDIGSRGGVTFSRGIASKLDALLDKFLSSTGQLTAKTDSIASQIASIAEERIELNARVNTVEARYKKQFTALDILIGQLKNTSNFLEQQLNSLPKIGGDK